MPKKSVDNDVAFKIERILRENTDGVLNKETRAATPRFDMSAKEILEALDELYGVQISKEMLRKILHAQCEEQLGLKPIFLGELSSVDLWGYATSDSKNAKARYFVVRSVSRGEIEHLIQLARSTSAYGESKELFYSLASGLCTEDAKEIKAIADQTLKKSNPYHNQFIKTQENVARIRRVMSLGRSMSYLYVGNGEEGIQHTAEIPLCIDIMEGYPYVVCLLKTKFGKWVHKTRRIDAMRKIVTDSATSSLEYPSDYKKRVEYARESIRGAVNRMPGHNVVVMARCHDKHMRKYVEDIFGNKEMYAKLNTEAEGCQDYRFKASFKGTKIQALKWSEWFEILEPQDLREAIIEALDINVYRRHG